MDTSAMRRQPNQKERNARLQGFLGYYSAGWLLVPTVAIRIAIRVAVGALVGNRVYAPGTKMVEIGR